MFGLFSILNSLVSVIFPVYESYRSLESYNKVANEIALSNVNIGGFQVPINVLLRKSGDSTNGNESNEESLQRNLISIQKWMVYWIVYVSLSVAESVLLLRYIVPMYSFIRLGVSIWLVSPMIVGPVGDAVRGNSVAAHKKEFVQFLESGCGLCYYRFIRPWLDGKCKLPGGFDLSYIVSPSILKNVSQYELIRYLTSFLNHNNSGGVLSESSFFDSVKSKVVDFSGSYLFANNFFSERGKNESGTSKSIVNDDANTLNDLAVADSSLLKVLYEEYDIVDNPGMQDGIGEESIKFEPKVEKRKGWIW